MNSYLAKYAVLPNLVHQRPASDLGIVVVIPSCNETQIDLALSALYNCTLPICAVEVLVVINAAEDASVEVLLNNAATMGTCRRWKAQHDSPAFRIHPLEVSDIPSRKAGVGYARKIGMDEAVRRFEAANNPNGIIASFDADCTCTPNYLTELYAHFANHPKTPACTIRFAYPTFGSEYDAENYLGITFYELHMRYYHQACRAAGFHNAYHALGAAMAVRSSAYQKQGGMNTRKSEEDFYFLQQYIAMGHFTELNTTLVIPAPRVSLRVPYGTGKVLADFVNADHKRFYTFNPQAFRYLHTFFKHLPEFYITSPKLEHLGGSLPYIVIDFLSAYFFEERIAELRGNSRGYNSFEKRFYQWFNALMVLKFVIFVRDNAHPNVRVERAALELLRQTGYSGIAEIRSTVDLVQAYRSLDEAPRRWQCRYK